MRHMAFLCGCSSVALQSICVFWLPRDRLRIEATKISPSRASPVLEHGAMDRERRICTQNVHIVW